MLAKQPRFDAEPPSQTPHLQLFQTRNRRRPLLLSFPLPSSPRFASSVFAARVGSPSEPSLTLAKPSTPPPTGSRPVHRQVTRAQGTLVTALGPWPRLPVTPLRDCSPSSGVAAVGVSERAFSPGSVDSSSFGHRCPRFLPRGGSVVDSFVSPSCPSLVKLVLCRTSLPSLADTVSESFGCVVLCC